MTLTPGIKLGPYEIVAPLGAGGMGEVYRARDTRLGRDVAVKVLPHELSGNAEVRARFEREARTVSGLSHPNICTLFDVGREGETEYLVMELVEGETLAQRIARGPLPITDVIRLGSQIADALDRAHRAGVVHRDLKPANVMLARSGAKLMDFGLARRTDPGVFAAGRGPHDLTQSPTMAAPLTAEGTILGTFQYMSPEQLEGREADARSDVWAFGCVLYEMATGRRAFEGRSPASMIGAIMTTEPAKLSSLAPMAPQALDDIVHTCLAKDPDDRWQSTGDLRRELQKLQGSAAVDPSSASGVRAVVAARRGPSARVQGAAVLAGLALLVAIGFLLPRLMPASPPRLMTFKVGKPAGDELAFPAEPDWSPDGSMFACTVTDSDGVPSIAVRSLADLQFRVLPGTAGAALPFWSPDGKSLGYFAGGKLRRVDLDGSSATTICDAPDGRGGSWSKADMIVFAPTALSAIQRVSAKGGAPVAVTAVDSTKHERGHRYPQFLPDGEHFLFVALTPEEQLVTYAASVKGGPVREVCRGGSMARFAPPDRVLYFDQQVNDIHLRLLSRHFDPRSQKVSGDPQLIAEDVQSDNFGYTNASVSSKGDLLFQHYRGPRQALLWVDRDGHPSGTAFAELDLGSRSAALSPDGRRIAFPSQDPRDLFVAEIGTQVATRLTFNDELVQGVTFSPDGRRIAYSGLDGMRGWGARLKNADGTGKDSLYFHAPGLFTAVLGWTPTGDYTLIGSRNAAGRSVGWLVPMSGSGSPHPFNEVEGLVGDAKISPDGHWLASVVSKRGTRQAFVHSFPDLGATLQLPVDDPVTVIWGDTSRELFIEDANGKVVRVALETDNGIHAAGVQTLFHEPKAQILVGRSRVTGSFLVAQDRPGTLIDDLDVTLGWRATRGTK